MEKLDNKAIIGRFMNKQIEIIYKKYLNISDQEENLVGSFIRKLEEGKVDFFDPFLDYENTKRLAEELQDVKNIDVIKLYIFLKSDLKLAVDLDDVRYYHEKLMEKGYKQIHDYLLYDDYEDSQLKARIEEILVYDLEEPDRVLDLYSAEELAEMWIFRTSFEEAASNLIDDDGWEEISKVEYLGTAYFDELNREIFSCEVGDDGLFDQNEQRSTI